MPSTVSRRRRCRRLTAREVLRPKTPSTPWGRNPCVVRKCCRSFTSPPRAPRLSGRAPRVAASAAGAAARGRSAIRSAVRSRVVIHTGFAAARGDPPVEVVTGVTKAVARGRPAPMADHALLYAPAGERRHDHGHGHSHGLIDASIKRSQDGVRAVLLSLAVLAATAAAQALVFMLSGSVALLADLVHNVGDALTAVPLGIAFVLRSERAERVAGLFVVLAIFASACVAGVEAVSRLLDPEAPSHLGALALGGAVGYVANIIAARVRTRAGRRLDSPALIADGNHAKADAYVSLAVIASAAVVAIGVPLADPIIGLGITLVILRITWQ